MLLFSSLYVFLHKKSYHIPIAIKYNFSNIPVIDITIENRSLPIAIDLGSHHSLALKEEYLKDIINKEKNTVIEWYNIRGKKNLSPSFLLFKIEIGNVTFQDVKVIEISKEMAEDSIIGTIEMNKNEFKGNVKNAGYIGRTLLQKFNFLMDFPNQKMILSNDLNKIKKEGFCLEKCEKVPFEITLAGITILVKTDIGMRRFLIDTGCTKSLIRNKNQIDKVSLDNILTTSKFLIEKTDFRDQDLLLFPLPDDLNEIDGIIGMDFLNKHMLYFDFPNKLIYIDKNQKI